MPKPSSGGKRSKRGEPSATGRMKKAIVYHGSYADFDRFDNAAAGDKHSVNQYGEGYYFTDEAKIARNYGDIIYKVEVLYSTDRRTSKRTGRERDYQYNKKTGYWVIPLDKADNIRIISKTVVE